MERSQRRRFPEGKIEVMVLAARGRCDHRIARELNLAVATVKRHLTR